MGKTAGLVLILLTTVALARPSPAQDSPSSPGPASRPPLTFGGQLSLLSSGRFDTSFAPFFSLRFLPEVRLALVRPAAAGGLAVDAEASANAYGSALLAGDRPAELDGALRPYRAWLRLSVPRFEARIGLQKVSFGSAALFRPLMWFDGLDPRDPLQLTDGVTGVLLRYYPRGNVNIWAWALYGNDARRGFDLAPPDEKTPEFGGRVQVPLFKGEIGVTVHRRRAVIDGLTPVMDPASPIPVAPVPEDRIGLDGKWDLGLGLWLEGALVHQHTPLLPYAYQLSLTAGLDTTFGLGRGLYALVEHFRYEASAAAFAAGQPRNVSALLARYPFGLSDELAAIVAYDWTGRALYRTLSWKRTSDALSFSVIAFWNPETVLLYPGQAGSSSFAGTGLELVLAYDF